MSAGQYLHLFYFHSVSLSLSVLGRLFLPASFCKQKSPIGEVFVGGRKVAVKREEVQRIELEIPHTS